MRVRVPLDCPWQQKQKTCNSPSLESRIQVFISSLNVLRMGLANEQQVRSLKGPRRD